MRGAPDVEGEVDALGDLQPRCAGRQEQHVDGYAGQGQRVTGVEDRLAIDVEEVAAVVEVRQALVDHRVLLADHRDRQAVDLLARVHDGGPRVGLRRLLADLRRDRRDRVDRRVGGQQVVGRVVVRMLVGDQDRGRTVNRLAFAEAARVDDQALVVVLDPDACMAELREPHLVETSQ